jgi:GNAT superfamily N-acetyltransferase
LVEPREAPLLVGLIRRCYGDTYIDPSFYDEGSVSSLLESRTLHSIGAFESQGALVGHMGITLRAHGGNTADAGMTLVDPAWRGRGIAKRVALGLAQQSVALGLVGVHDYPVTVHDATQRIGAGFGVDTGLMLANVPADVVFEDMRTASGTRSSSVIRWLPFGRVPERDVFLPGRYRAFVEALYEQARLPRAALDSSESLAKSSSTIGRAYDERRRTLRLTATRLGQDIAQAVDTEIRAAAQQGAVVAHVDLLLGDPCTPVASEALRPLGFFFAGVLPEYRGGDVLRMQWLSNPGFGRSGVLSDEARAVAAFVLEDRSQTLDAEVNR